MQLEQPRTDSTIQWVSDPSSDQRESKVAALCELSLNPIGALPSLRAHRGCIEVKSFQLEAARQKPLDRTRLTFVITDGDAPFVDGVHYCVI